MGTIKHRDISKIHDRKISLINDTNTYIAHAEINNSSRKISIGDYQQNGCCTNAMNLKFSNGNQEYMFIRYNLNVFPTMYRDLKYIKKWINFINTTFPFSDIKILHHDKETLIEDDYWQSKKISFSFSKKDYVYFSIKKVGVGQGSYKNLLTLSLLRAFATAEYFFMVYDTLRLRKLKSLQDLSNWDILNIAKYGMQCNNYNHNSAESLNAYAFLRGYRFPLELNYAHYAPDTFDNMLKKITLGNNQNNSCKNNNFIAINPIYMMLLFQKKQYRKLYELMVDKKYQFDNLNNKKIKTLMESYKNNPYFNAMNELKIDFTEYAKTL